MTSLMKILSLTTELVAKANQFLDSIQLLNVGAVSEEPLTASQKANIKARAKSALNEIKATIDAIKAEINV